MRGKFLTFITGLALALTTHAEAKSALTVAEAVGGGGPAPAMPGVLQCVPFARNTSGIRLYGDAHTWWSQAEGKYARGRMPMPGAVMAIRPHGGSTLGHVATVSRVIDARTILISHANWSAPGKIERDVTAMDVSRANDWSEVRVWYAPIHNLGGAHWPVSGFIYKGRSDMTTARSTLTKFVPGKMAKVRFGNEPELAAKTPPRLILARTASKQPAKLRVAPQRLAKVDIRRDPIGAIIARSR